MSHVVRYTIAKCAVNTVDIQDPNLIFHCSTTCPPRNFRQTDVCFKWNTRRKPWKMEGEFAYLIPRDLSRKL